MNITILSVGKIKEKYLVAAINEYQKRISKFATVKFIELKDEPLNYKDSEKLDLKVKEIEGEKICQKLSPSSYNIALDLGGETLDSVELSNKMQDIFTYNSSNICFVIGGSLGLSEKVLKTCDYSLCFSKLTFPHQLMKVILLEQVYRSFKILNNETYHK